MAEVGISRVFYPAQVGRYGAGSVIGLPDGSDQDRDRSDRG